MTAKRLDGKLLAQQMRAEIASAVAARTATGKRPPGLAVVLVGDDPASRAYVRNKQKGCAEVGVESSLHHLPAGHMDAGTHGHRTPTLDTGRRTSGRSDVRTGHWTTVAWCVTGQCCGRLVVI